MTVTVTVTVTRRAKDSPWGKADSAAQCARADPLRRSPPSSPRPADPSPKDPTARRPSDGPGSRAGRLGSGRGTASLSARAHADRPCAGALSARRGSAGTRSRCAGGGRLPRRPSPYTTLPVLRVGPGEKGTGWGGSAGLPELRWGAGEAARGVGHRCPPPRVPGSPQAWPPILSRQTVRNGARSAPRLRRSPRSVRPEAARAQRAGGAGPARARGP